MIMRMSAIFQVALFCVESHLAEPFQPLSYSSQQSLKRIQSYHHQVNRRYHGSVALMSSSPPKWLSSLQNKKDTSITTSTPTMKTNNKILLADQSTDIKSNTVSPNEIMDVMSFFGKDDRQDLSDMKVEEDKGDDEEGLITPAIFGGIVVLAAVALSQNPTSSQFISNLLADPSTTLQSASDAIASMGDVGVFYFATIYIVAEVLAIPAIPLTASAGYIFGVQEGTAVVLLSGSVAAAVSFLIGRTLLRERVERILIDYPRFQAIDNAIGREGFKIMVLLRLSPIFPFALSNYLYGVTSVKFWPYFWGTVLGFAPGTLAYVYTGTVGKALTLGDGASEPWYVYGGILAVAVVLLKTIADVATGVIEELEEEEGVMD